ncbi:MAG: FtsQ-type POTRA domain-containing protein [Candidatus Margulisiibacteriota bacterium]
MKARSKKKRNRFRLVTRLFTLAVLAGLGYYFLSLSIWNIQEIAVEGTKMLSPQELRDYSGLPLGRNLFFTSFRPAHKKLDRVGVIKKHRIRRLPPATILIVVEERRPIAVLVINNRFTIVDRDGYILNNVPALNLQLDNITDLPVISGLGTEELISAARIAPRLALLINETVVELSHLLGSRRINLEIGSYRRINIMLDDVLRIDLGQDERITTKIAVVKRLLPGIAGRWNEVECLDVRFPETPVIKFKK